MLRRGGVAGALAALSLGAAVPAAVTTTAADAAATRACSSFGFVQGGTPWKAREIRVTGVSCASARKLIRLYAKPRNCQFLPTCTVSVYRCRTLSVDGSVFTQRCTRSGGRAVRWRGSYSPS